MSDRPIKSANQRGTARLGAVQALYQMELTGDPLERVIAEFEAFRLGREVDGVEYLPADAGYFRKLMVGVLREQRPLDRAIDATLAEGWPLKRLDALLRALLRAGTYELMVETHVPVRVVLDEYLDIAGAFYEDEEKRLTNGVLNALAKEFRSEELGSSRGFGTQDF